MCSVVETFLSLVLKIMIPTLLHCYYLCLDFGLLIKNILEGLFYCKLAFYEMAHIKLFLEMEKREIPMICSGVSSLAHDL